ncbi:MAG: type II secretion system F family protein [Schwartzia sp.]|nr:type II secretion system F family protein [Schwartzia sp. (in: firmicutes)]MBQ5413467.1 type II secretion system F family protein [Schwartzia sp. (in: firmicutes)]
MNFIYEAKTEENIIRRGSITADSERDAARILQLQGLFVTRLLPAWRKNAQISLKKSHPKFVVSFFRQTAVMLKAGITLSGAMEALLRQKQTEKEKEVISGMYRSIRAGGTLASAMKAYPAWFPKSAAAVVHAGEESGTLDRLLAKIADVMGRQYDMKEKRMTLLAYPAILFLTSFFAAVFLLTFVFPVFVSFFEEMHTALPWPTRLVLGIYGGLRDYGAFIAAGLAVFAAAAAMKYRKKRIRERVDFAMLRIPVLGKLFLYQELSKIAGILAVLIESGIVMNRALDITAETTDNAYICMASGRAARDIEKGFTLSASLEKAEIFPELFLNLINTGERTGSLEEMLYRLAAAYEEESERLSGRMHTLIEPFMVLTAGGVIGTLIFAIALPILDMMTSLSGS